MIEKATGLEADQIFLDLEDSVPPGVKAKARMNVISALRSLDFEADRLSVRVNEFESRHQFEDIAQLVSQAGEKLDSLILPKVNHPGHLWYAEVLLAQIEAAITKEYTTRLEIMVETPSALVNLKQISEVTNRVENLIFGSGDYNAAIGVPDLEIGVPNPAYHGSQWHYPLAHIIAVARSFSLGVLDGPYGAISDLDGFRESCSQARVLGADGKLCIHPSQVAVANEVFSPSIEEFQRAQELLAAYEDAVNQGRGAILFKGKMVDEASRRLAERCVRLGKAAGLR